MIDHPPPGLALSIKDEAKTVERLRRELRTCGNQIIAFGTALRNDPASVGFTNCPPGIGSGETASGSATTGANMVDWQAYTEVLNLERIAGLVSDLRAAEARLLALRQRARDGTW